MAQKRLYPKCVSEMDRLGEHLKGKYPETEWETQFVRIESDGRKGAAFQVRPKTSAWQKVKDWTGMGKAATVSMKAVGDALEVEVGGGKWVDKATAVNVGILIFPTLIVTAGIGAWLQNRLLSEVLTEVEAYFHGEATALRCAECGADHAAEAKFCSACGKAVGQQAQV